MGRAGNPTIDDTTMGDDAGSRELINGRIYWVWILIIAGLIFRLTALGLPELWYDEAFGRLILSLPFNRMIAATAGDVHPPLWYAIMWFWVRITGAQTEFLFRLPAVLFSLAAIPIAWRIMERWKISWIGRIAVGVWVALSPIEIYFGQEARMYSLFQFLFLLGVLAIIERRIWLLFLSGLGLLYTHNYGLFYLASLGGLAIIQAIRDRPGGVTNRQITSPAGSQNLFRALIALSSAFVLFITWIIVVLVGQMAEISSGYWIEPVTVGQLVYTLTIYLFGPFTRQMVLSAALVATGMLVFSLVKRSHKTAYLPELAMLTFAPLALAILASIVWRPVYLWRGFIASAPFLYILVLPPMVDLTGWRRLYIAALVAPMLIGGSLGYWLDINDFKSTTLEAVERIRAEWQEGDVLYSTNDGNWVMFTLYQDDPVYLMPQCADHDNGALSDLTRQALGVQEIPLDMIDHKRVWLLWNWGAQTSDCNHDQAAKIVGDREPWWLVKETNIMSSGIWLLEVP